MQLPVLTNGMEWKVVMNTYFEYRDDIDFSELAEMFGPNTMRIPPRTTVILLAV